MSDKHISPEDVTRMTKEEKIALVKRAAEEVNASLGDMAPHVSRKKKIDMIQEKLPLRRLYDNITIDLILSGTY